MCKSKAEGGHRCTGEKRVRTKEEHAELVLARRQRNALAASKQRAKRRSQQGKSSSLDSRPPVRKTKALIAAEDKLALMQSSFDHGKCTLESLEMQRNRVDELYAKAKPLKTNQDTSTETTVHQGESSKKTDLTPDDRSEAVVAPDDSQKESPQTTVNPFEKFLQEVDTQGSTQTDTQGSAQMDAKGSTQTDAQGAPQVETETTVHQQESSKKDKVVAPEKDAFDSYVDTMLETRNAVGWTDADGRAVLWKDALDTLTP